jgi:hypothetical protein
MMVCYTGINIPYNALSGVMSGDPQERTTVNGLRFIFAFSGSTLVTAATPFLVKWLGGGNERLGWQLTMVLWGLAASGLFVVTFFNTRERIAPPPAQHTQVRQDIKDLAHNGPWLALFFLALIIMMTITLRTSTAAYYFKYFVGRPELMAAFVPAYMAAAAAGASLTPLLTRFIDKKETTTYVPGTVDYYTFPYPDANSTGSYQPSVGYISSPGYTVKNKTVLLLTNLYKTADQKLLWTATTNTTTQADNADIVRSFIGAVIKRMEKDGLIKKQ